MKIDGLEPVKQPGEVKPAQKTDKPSAPSFADTLAGALGVGATKESTSTGSVTPATPISKIPFLTNIAPELSGSAISSLEGFINDLDLLKNGLGNEEISLDRLREIIEAIANRKDEFADMIGKTPDGEIKGLLTDAIKVAIEQINQFHNNSGTTS